MNWCVVSRFLCFSFYYFVPNSRHILGGFRTFFRLDLPTPERPVNHWFVKSRDLNVRIVTSRYSVSFALALRFSGPLRNAIISRLLLSNHFLSLLENHWELMITFSHEPENLLNISHDNFHTTF